MATKNRIVYLMRYLQENSDENHPVTTAQIREEMAQKGCPIIIPLFGMTSSHSRTQATTFR